MMKVHVSRSVKMKERFSKLTASTKHIFETLEKKVEGTFAEKLLKFWTNLGRDYRDVAVDVAKDIRTKPSKAILLGTTGWLATTFALRNPNETHFRDAFKQAANDAIQVHHSLVKPEVLQHLKQIEHSYNNKKLRHTSFGLFSLVWIDKYSKQCTTYEHNCQYLQLRYAEIFDRIIDIGFLDTWWCLAYKMRDYDINY